ncbi:MAG: tetratricopeptide repeat protein, partial [Sphingomicrobium sp.]
LSGAVLASGLMHAGVIALFWYSAADAARLPEMRVYSVNIVSPPPQLEGEPSPGVPAPAAPAAASALHSRLRKFRRSWPAAAAASLLIVVTGAVVLLGRGAAASPDAVALKPFEVVGNSPSTQTFAAGVSEDVGNALTAAGLNVVDPNARKAAFVLGGRAELPGSDLHLTAELRDGRDHTMLWSTSFTRSASQSQAMREQVAASLAAVLHCALDTVNQPAGESIDQETVKLYLKACDLEQAADPPLDQIRGLLEQVTRRAPRFALAWARLAFAAANGAFGVPAEQGEAMRREARVAAQTAIRLNPKSGLAYEALTDLEFGHVPLAELHRQFQKVLGFDPNNADVLNDDGELLLRVGRLDEAVQLFRRGVELDPLSPHQTVDLVGALIDESRNTEAEATLQRALRIWPDDKSLRFARLDYEARLGDPDKALAIVNDPAARPNIRDVSLELYRRLAQARKSGKEADKRAFTGWLNSQIGSGAFDAGLAAPALAAFGDRDGAFKLAFAAPSEASDPNFIDPIYLWDPDSETLRKDPRFIALNRRLHVTDFWHATGKWPDFCSAPKWPYNCKTEDARLASKA